MSLPTSAQTETLQHWIWSVTYCIHEEFLLPGSAACVCNQRALGGCVYSLGFGSFLGGCESCCIPLDVQSFAQRMFSIPNWIWGFARGGNRGRNQLLGLDLIRSDGSELLSALPSREQEFVQEGSALDLAAAGECARDVWECWSLVTGLTAIVCSLPAAPPLS